MRRIVTLAQFEKDFRLMRKRGKDPDKLQAIVQRLTNDEPLEPRHRDHSGAHGHTFGFVRLTS